MSKYDLSICIPARNEEWLSRTVQDILQNRRGKTEVIVFLDGAWANPGIPDHPDVRIIHVSESIGQRAATNRCVKLSKARYIMKLDAHCSMSEGFDVEMLKAFEECGDNVVMAPTMRNLHVFNWKCMTCGKQTYQGPTPGTSGSKFSVCEDCGANNFKRKVIWHAKPSPQSTSYCFDPEPHFQYFNDFKKRPEGRGDLTPSMSLQGSCFMVSREKYWELNICDEKTFGSWGSQGIEVACKFWLTGGQVLINQKCYYAHCFRTQGGDFSFPYPQQQSKVNEAKAKAKQLFFQSNLPNQKHPLSWLVEKFWPVYGWKDSDLAALKATEKHEPTKAIVFFTDNQLPLKIARPVQRRLREISAELSMPIVSASLKPMDNMGKNVVVGGERGYLTMFRQILAALEASDADVIFMAEHDVIYPKEHFEFTPTDKNTFYYDHNWVKYHLDDGLAVTWEADQVSGLCAYRETLIEYYEERIASFDKDNFDRKFEPGSGIKSESWYAPAPHIDIRHGKNLTYNKRSLDDFRDKTTATGFKQLTIDKIPGWDNLGAIIKL